jgi:hypothetical protein
MNVECVGNGGDQDVVVDGGGWIDIDTIDQYLMMLDDGTGS